MQWSGFLHEFGRVQPAVEPEVRPVRGRALRNAAAAPSPPAPSFGVRDITLIVAIAAIFGLLWNARWCPGNDSDFYLVIARNLHRGLGYEFNGRQVVISPPGWPMVLAGAFRLTTQFGLLKLIAMTSMAAFLGLSYRVLLRYASPRRALAVILACAINANLYPLTVWLHSDALFCAVSALGILLALQVREGRRAGWRCAGIIALCITATLLRWAGLPGATLVAGALLRRGGSGKLTKPRMVMAVACVLAAAITFLAVDSVLTARRSAEDARLPPDQTVLGGQIAAPAMVRHPVAKYLGDVGRWNSALLWAPLKASAAVPALEAIAVTLGFAAIAAVVAGAVALFRRSGSFLWIALPVYMLGLVLFWRHVEARYLVPILPFLLLAIIEGIDAARIRWPRAGRQVWLVARALGATVMLCNVSLYATDAFVARSPDFSARYDAGMDRSLVGAATFLQRTPTKSRQIAISLRSNHIDSVRLSTFGQRVVMLIADREVLCVPPERSISLGAAGGGDLLAHLRRRGIRYYLCQHPAIPRQVGYIRLPWRAQQWLALDRTSSPASTGGWELWEIDPERARRLELSPSDSWPTRVPGL